MGSEFKGSENPDEPDLAVTMSSLPDTNQFQAFMVSREEVPKKIVIAQIFVVKMDFRPIVIDQKIWENQSDSIGNKYEPIIREYPQVFVNQNRDMLFDPSTVKLEKTNEVTTLFFNLASLLQTTLFEVRDRIMEFCGHYAIKDQDRGIKIKANCDTVSVTEAATQNLISASKEVIGNQLVVQGVTSEDFPNGLDLSNCKNVSITKFK